MRIVTWLLTLAIIIVGIIFAALNAKAVEVNYLFGIKAMPLALMLLISLALGVFLSILTLGFSILKLTAKNKWLESKLKKTQEHLSHAQS